MDRPDAENGGDARLNRSAMMKNICRHAKLVSSNRRGKRGEILEIENITSNASKTRRYDYLKQGIRNNNIKIR